MYYTCHSRLSRETGANSDQCEEGYFETKFRNIFAQLGRFRKTGPDWVSTFCLYASLVHEYSKRKLSYDTDVINAFSGISTVLGHLLNSRSVSGLIECVLGVCLLWVPGISNIHCRNLNFPSWSWAGWRREVFYFRGPLYDARANFGDFYPSDLLLRSLIVKFETQSMSPLRPILRLLQHEANSAIASGESEITRRGIDLLSFEATNENITQLNLSSGESMWMWGNICLASNETRSRSVRLSKITDTNQKICGYLHYFPRMLSIPTRAPNYRELVALSLSMPVSEIYNYSILFDHKVSKRKEWCLLNIMLVEWKGSEAERVTIGKIYIDAWDSLETQRKLIRLI